MKLKLLSDGSPSGTKMVAGPAREAVENVVGYTLEASQDDPTTQLLTITVVISDASKPKALVTPE